MVRPSKGSVSAWHRSPSSRDISGRGIGSLLVREGLAACGRAGYGFVVCWAPPEFYRRFGFDRADGRGLGNEYGAEEEFMVLELRDGSIPGRGGLVRFGPESRKSPSDRGGSRHMRRVAGYSLWLGHAGDVRDVPGMLAAGSSAVIDLAIEEAPGPMTRELLYCRFPLVDGPGNPPWMLRVAVELVAGLIRDDVATLVGCGAA